MPSQSGRLTKTKAAFPTDDALLKSLYLAMQDITPKWTMRLPHWGQVLRQLTILFPGRMIFPRFSGHRAKRGLQSWKRGIHDPETVFD
jgi:hypothetical protein